jgi:tRNA-specific 2-thiouridylase
MIADFQLDRPIEGARIVVAMSGGVDSSVVAALAARSGAEVIGVTLQLYDHGEAVGRAKSCCAGRDIYDARTVADRLGIAHYVFDLASRFKEDVIDRFADSYAAGRHADPVHPVQSGGEVHRLVRDRAGSRRGLPGDRPLCATRDGAPRPRAAPRGGSGARPELFPVCHHARAARIPALPAGGAAEAGGARAGARARPAGRRQAGQQDICFVPGGDYAAVVRKVRPEAAVPARSSMRRVRCSGGTRD